MARIKGAVSSVGISLQDLIEIVGPDYKGTISVGKKWLDSVMSPEEFQIVKVGAEKQNNKITICAAPSATVEVIRPKFTTF